MGLFDRFTRRGAARPKAGVESDARHLADWARSHRGVEAYIEPETTVTELTVVLVAYDGEWTRRKVGGERGARKLGQELKIPVYDVRKTGYPQRMRDYDNRRRIERKRERQREFD
ncbi:oxidoreductase [Prescottella agglutinans]|uniref:Oxidoreductase n=1 Tax=Prescottella agglutinans TaxID=1644129 RepID=A0A3S3AIJ3_9NOCA|nr:oxidoreductase [Prescottella agglutinans]RVW10914.1 oxidoreductase [Prescottella agglutinans]